MEFQPPKGTRDIMQKEAELFQKMIDTVRYVFKKYGFSPLFTPAFEDFALLSVKGGLGENVKDDIYFFKDKSDRELGLRFDLTMPMVRVVSANPQIKKPFKRYAIGKVWRYDNPQAMRYREFWQADVDIVGSDSALADAECLAVSCECLEKLGFDDFNIRLNNRKLLQQIFKNEFGVKDQDVMRDVFRSMDKIDKIGKDGVEKEISEIGISPKMTEKIIKFISTKGKNTAVLKSLEKKYGSNEGLEEIKKLVEYCKYFDIGKNIKIDLSLVRGLDYYTGSVFEINLGEDVSCGGGGRYDKLIDSVGGIDIPATGISLGISRIFEIMKSRDMFSNEYPLVFVANVSEELLGKSINIANKLREKGIITETDSMGRDLKSQLSYADSIEATYSIIVGEKEIKDKIYTLKDMENKSEEKMNLKDIIKKLKSSRKMNR